LLVLPPAVPLVALLLVDVPPLPPADVDPPVAAFPEKSKPPRIAVHALRPPAAATRRSLV